MPSYACPVCGDPSAYPIWVDAIPPAGCPHDESWQLGGSPGLTTMCGQQIEKARKQAERRRLVPEAFDGHGNILPGKGAWMISEYHKRKSADEVKSKEP